MVESDLTAQYTKQCSRIVQEYETLWENAAPMPQIVEFCRQHLNTKFVYDRQFAQGEPDETSEKRYIPLDKILQESNKWGDMVLMPSFLMHIQDDDKPLLKKIGEYLMARLKSFYLYHRAFNSIARILSMKNRMPDKILAFFWTLVRKINWIYDGCVPCNCLDIALIDNSNIKHAMFKRKHRGYELIPPGLVFMDGRIHIKLSKNMYQAITEDSISQFEIDLTLTGKKPTASLLREMMHYRAYNIICHLLQHRTKEVTAILSAQDWLIWICANAEKCEGAIKVLDILEQLQPGISKCKDTLGNTPLWYCLYKSGMGREKLEEALIKYGCDPDARNHLNLSYNLCKNA